jgi:hypothetical protein
VFSCSAPKTSEGLSGKKPLSSSVSFDVSFFCVLCFFLPLSPIVFCFFFERVSPSVVIPHSSVGFLLLSCPTTPSLTLSQFDGCETLLDVSSNSNPNYEMKVSHLPKVFPVDPSKNSPSPLPLAYFPSPTLLPGRPKQNGFFEDFFRACELMDSGQLVS